MTLEAGQQLLHYRLIQKIGEGGMGEVYRATDSKLKREVAIKVLPQAFTEDPERLARFEREAQLLAQLQHPNIASIYGLEQSDGTRALVMELVDGPTLAERLAQGPLPVEECLAVARQIAEALEEAHEKGIIHRDLKPQNVKAPVEGQVKVLDFGLAKAMDSPQDAAGPDSASQISASPTLTIRATLQGVILGTAAYMAPEQAAGVAADHRADIWSFGVVLYEMLVGRRLFDGDTVSHVLAGVLKDEPDFALLPPDLPPRVRRLVQRCLRKKPRERLQSIGDARVVLDEVLAGDDRDEAATAWIAAAPAKASSRTAIAATGLLALALGVAAGALLLAPRPEPAARLRLELAVPAGQNLSTHEGHPGLALSPDGRRLALSTIDDEGNTGLLLRDFEQLAPRRIEGTEGARAPFFSPDGEWIGYFDSRALLKVKVAGGKPIRLAEVDDRSRGGVWGSDGYVYFSPDTNSGIRRVSEAGGLVDPVTELDAARDERTHRWPDLSPDGGLLVYTSDSLDSPNYYDDARIEAVRPGEREPHVLVEGASAARMLTDDLLVYANAGNLFVVRLDRKTLSPRGKPVALEQDVATSVGSGAVQFAVSRTGTAAWLSGEPYGMINSPLWYDREGNSTPAGIAGTTDVHQLALSPDGRRVAVRGSAYEVGSGPREADLWVGDLTRGTLTRLTFRENASSPTWTPDGSRIAYMRNLRQGGEAPPAGHDREIAWRAADSGGEPEVLLTGPGPYFEPDAFSPDGRYLVFHRATADAADLFLLPLDPRGDPRPFLATPFNEYAASVSPDGKWAAYHSNESGRFEVYVRPFPEGAGKWQISPGGGREPRWSPAGGELFYRDLEGRLLSVAVETASTFRAATPQVLWQAADFRTGANPKSYDVSPDGQRFLVLPTYFRGLAAPVVNYGDDWIPRARRLLERDG